MSSRLAIDTNILVRLAVRDDARQYERALNAIEAAESIFLSPVVVAETYWVLRSVYKIEQALVLDFFAKLDMVTILWKQRTHLKAAVLLTRAGMDFADALIAAESSMEGFTFATFDRSAAKKLKAAALPVEVL